MNKKNRQYPDEFKEQAQELMEKLLVPGVAFGIIPGDYLSTARPGIIKADDPTRNL